MLVSFSNFAHFVFAIIIITPQFSSIFDFENGYCVVIKMVDGLQIVGAVDANGRYADLEKLGNEPVSKLENGLTIVKSITSYPLFSLMDSNGMLLLPFKYNTIELLENGQYRVSVGNVYEKMELWEDEPQFRVAVGNILYGVLNDKLEEIIRPKYTDIEDCGSCYILSEGQQTELGDLCGKIIVPNRYQIRRAAEHLFWIYEANTMNSSRRNTNKEGLYGLINENGEMLLSPRYYQIQDFINGFACVMGGGRWVEEDDESSQVYRDGHWGVIDTDGKEIIPLLYDAIKYEADASLFKVNFSKVHSGYIDIRGKRVIKGPDGKFMAVSPNYQWQDDYEGGVSTVYYSGSKGRVNDRGEQLIYYQKDGVQLETILPAQFDWGYDSDSQCIIVEKENNVGLYSAVEDRIVLELQYKGIQAVRTADRTHRLWRTISRSGRYGLATEIGEVVLPAKYWGIRPLAFALFEVMVEGWEYVLYDAENDNLYQDRFTEIFQFGERLDSECFFNGEERIIKHSQVAIVRRGDRYGAINNSGRVIVPLEYTSAILKEGNFIVCNDITFDCLGRVVSANSVLAVPMPEIYKSAKLLDNNLIIAQKNSCWGCLNLSMIEIVPFIYESIEGGDFFFIVSRKKPKSESLELGVIDVENNIVVPFSDVDEIIYDRGLFLFKKKGLYGAYSESGTFICDALYERIERLNSFLIKVGVSYTEYGGDMDYENECCWVHERKIILWGLVDVHGKEILPCNYNDIDEKKFEGLIQIKQGEFLGLLDITGKIVLEPKYFQIADFEDSYSIVLGTISISGKNGKAAKAKAYGVIDSALKEVIPCCFNSIEYEKETGMFRTEKGYKLKDGRFVCSVGSKKIRIPSEYMYCREFYNDHAVSVKLNHPGFKYGLLDSTGQDILPPIFDSLVHFYEDSYRFKINDLYGLINSDGSIILDNQYSGIGKLEDGVALITINRPVPRKSKDVKTYGLINMSGKQILKPEYDSIGKATNGYCVLCKQGSWSFLNLQTQKEVQVENVGYLGFCHDERFVVNVGGKFVSGCKNRMIGGHWGFVDKDAEIVIEPKYEAARKFVKKRALVKYKGKWGAINVNGDIVIPFDYDFVYSNDDDNGCCKLLSGATIHVFDAESKEVRTYPIPDSLNVSDFGYSQSDFGYSQSDIDDMYMSAFEGDPDAQWNID